MLYCNEDKMLLKISNVARYIFMSDKSPLFVSSLELIAHSAEIFAQKNSKKYKFIILHMANAVELILKGPND
jgi:hypothetical protein